MSLLLETCPILKCDEDATTFIAVITKTDETKKQKDSKQQNLGSPMMLCQKHATERKEHFEEINRKVVMISKDEYEKLINNSKSPAAK